MIFRRWKDATVLSSRPRFENRQWSQAQKDNQKRFRKAMSWTREQLKDPVIYDHYRKSRHGMQTVWNVAVADYMKMLRLKELDTSGYKGHKGEGIRIRFYDLLRIDAVIITLLTSQGLLVDYGNAEKIRGLEWYFTAKADNARYHGSHIMIKVCSGAVHRTFYTRIT
jgi:hypothetical protein